MRGDAGGFGGIKGDGFTEKYLNTKNDQTQGLHGIEPNAPYESFAKATLLVCNKLSYTHESHYMSQKQVAGLFEHVRQCHMTGRPLNRFMTIQMKDLQQKSPQKTINDLMEKTRKWLKSKGHDPAYLWVLENGETKGIHAHLIIHIPKHCIHDYKRLIKKWLPLEITKTTLDFKTIKYPHYGHVGTRSCVYGVLKYMCKGINPSTPTHDIKPIYQGEIVGRRCGHSMTINTVK